VWFFNNVLPFKFGYLVNLNIASVFRLPTVGASPKAHTVGDDQMAKKWLVSQYFYS